VLALYLLALALGVGRLLLFPSDPDPDAVARHHAARRLVPNHLIRAEDVMAESAAEPPLDSIIGRYATMAIDSGKPIVPEALGAAPLFRVPPGKHLLTIRVTSLLLRTTLNAGSRVSLCDDQGCFLENMSVSTMQCGTDAMGTSCVAVLEVPRDLDSAAWRRLGPASTDPPFHVLLVSP
jgi:hypothetical protein